MSNTNHRLIDALKKNCAYCVMVWSHVRCLGLHAHKYIRLWETNDILVISSWKTNYLHEFYRR